MIVRSVRRERRIASAAARRSPRDEREVGGLDRDVGAGADREAEVGLGERGGVVDAVADHRDDRALAPAAVATTATLLGGQHLGDHRRRCRPRRRRRARSRSLSPVSRTGAQAERLAARAIASAERRLDACRRRRAAARSAPSQATAIAVRPAARPRPSRAASSAVERSAHVGEQRRAADDDGVAVDDALDAEALAVGEALDRRQLADAGARGARRSRARSGAREASSSAPARRSSSVALDAVGGDDVDERHLPGR